MITNHINIKSILANYYIKRVECFLVIPDSIVPYNLDSSFLVKVHGKLFIIMLTVGGNL